MQIFKILVVLILATTLAIINTPLTSYSQYDQNFLLPFSYKEVWDTNVINGRDDYGIHQDKIGVGIDLYNNRSLEILAPVSGNVSKGCVSKGVTSIIITRESGQVIRLIHLLDNTIKIASGYIKQGQVVGMTAPKGDYNGENCNVSSDDYHVHLSIGTREPNTCKFTIDGYNFDCSGMRPCSKSLDGSYNLTFSVNCNRKYLNQKFVSTNGFPLNNDQCNTLLKEMYENKTKRDQENILNIQVCLTKKGLYTGVYSRVYDDKTSRLVNQLFEPTKTVIKNNDKPQQKSEVKKQSKIKEPAPLQKTKPKVESTTASVVEPKSEPTIEKEIKEVAKVPEEKIQETKTAIKEESKEIDILKITSEYTKDNNKMSKILYTYLGLLLLLVTL